MLHVNTFQTHAKFKLKILKKKRANCICRYDDIYDLNFLSIYYINWHFSAVKIKKVTVVI